MNNIDPAQERVSSLRRSRIARRGLVLGAVAGSLGIAGALGLSAAVNPGTPTNGGSTGAPASNGGAYTGGDKGATNKSQKWIFLGDDGGESGEGHESDGGGQWVPVQPSPQFSGSTNGGSTNGGSTNGATPPAATAPPTAAARS